jgi:hypothetical protein
LATGVITVSRHKYAAGLFWQPAPARGGARETAAKIARVSKMHAKAFASFGGMIGVAPRWSGAHAGMGTAAPEVMEGLSESTFLAAFSVREGIWLLAARGGIFIKDREISDAAEARKHYDELNVMPDRGILIAPADWNAPQAVERRLMDLMSGARKFRLSSISHVPAYLMTAAIMAAAVLVGLTFFKEPIKKLLVPSPRDMKISPEAVAEYKKKLEELDAPKPKAPPKQVHVPLPYEALPNSVEKAEQCWQAIAFLAQPITGWVIDSITCLDGEANAHLKRNYGTIGDLYEEVSAKMPKARVDETGSNDVVLTAGLRPLGKTGQEPQYDADQIMTAIQSVFQRIDVDVDFRRDFAELAIPELGENEVLDTDWRDVPIVKIEATVKLEPMEFMKIMNDVSSVSLETVKWESRGRNWIYDIVIYVKQ